jgi:hypothetical protein
MFEYFFFSYRLEYIQWPFQWSITPDILRKLNRVSLPDKFNIK